MRQTADDERDDDDRGRARKRQRRFVEGHQQHDAEHRAGDDVGENAAQVKQRRERVAAAH